MYNLYTNAKEGSVISDDSVFETTNQQKQASPRAFSADSSTQDPPVFLQPSTEKSEPPALLNTVMGWYFNGGRDGGVEMFHLLSETKNKFIWQLSLKTLLS